MLNWHTDKMTDPPKDRQRQPGRRTDRKTDIHRRTETMRVKRQKVKVTVILRKRIWSAATRHHQSCLNKHVSEVWTWPILPSRRCLLHSLETHKSRTPIGYVNFSLLLLGGHGTFLLPLCVIHLQITTVVSNDQIRSFWAWAEIQTCAGRIHARIVHEICWRCQILLVRTIRSKTSISKTTSFKQKNSSCKTKRMDKFYSPEHS